MMATTRSAAAMLATALCLPVVATLRAGPPPDPEPGERLTRPSLVSLDFRDRPIAEVIRAIGERSGRNVSDQGGTTKAFSPVGAIRVFPPVRAPEWRTRKISLMAPGPVPFWEAVDRIAEAGQTNYRFAGSGDTGWESTVVVFGDDEVRPGGLVQYTGPLRVQLLAVHGYDEAIFVRGPWVRANQGNFYAAPVEAADLGAAPPDGGPLHAEIQVMAEPGLACRLVGPPANLEAVDDLGRPMLAAPAAKRPRPGPWFVDRSGESLILRVPLARPDAKGRTIRHFRGTIPVEIAAVRPEPSVAFKLHGAEGQTFRGGGMAITLETFRIEPDGRIQIAFRGEVEGEMAPERRTLLMNQFRKYQFRIVDASGARVQFSSSSSNGDLRGRASLAFVYTPGANSRPPAEFRYHEMDRVTWDAPFEFRDVPLPRPSRDGDGEAPGEAPR
jgi:hypothetical protein